MSDGHDSEWSAEQRESLGRQLSLLGKIGFFVQLALLVAPILLLVYILLIGRSHQANDTGLNFGNYISLGSLLVLIFTTFWFFRYSRLGHELMDPTRHPPRSAILIALWVGLWAGCLGIVLSMLLLLAAAWRILFVLLTNPQSGMLVAPTIGTNPTYSLSAIDAVSITMLIISLGAELMVLGMTLWLLFRMTWPAPQGAKARAEMSM